MLLPGGGSRKGRRRPDRIVAGLDGADGLERFVSLHPEARSLVVGTGGMALEEIFSTDPKALLAGG